MLDTIASYHCMQFQRNLMNQIEKMVRKTSFGHDFGPLWPKFGLPFFFKNMAPSVTRYHGHLSSCTISEKTDRQTDGRTDGGE